jgi:hypothetical protein
VLRWYCIVRRGTVEHNTNVSLFVALAYASFVSDMIFRLVGLKQVWKILPILQQAIIIDT